jgi:hypothetical protein
MQGRRPVRLRRTGEGRRAAMREMRLACPVVAPQGAPRILRRLAGEKAGPLSRTALQPSWNRPGTALLPHRNRSGFPIE